jgi:hypothetical protein
VLVLIGGTFIDGSRPANNVVCLAGYSGAFARKGEDSLLNPVSKESLSFSSISI